MIASMKTLLGFCVVFTAAICGASDFVIEQDVETGGTKISMLMQVKDSQARMDMGKETSIILNLETGDLTTIMHAQKMIMSMTGDQMQSMMQMGMKQTGASMEHGELVPTGKTDTINGFKTTQYLSKSADMEAEYWIAEDLPNADAMMKRFATLTKKLNENSPAPSVAMDPDKFPGFPIRTIMNMPSGEKVVSTVSRVEETEVPASIFELPEGYQSMQMPSIPSMGDLNFGN